MRLIRAFVVAGAMVAMAGCASGGTTIAPPTVDVTGKWAGTWAFRNPSLGSGQVSMDLKQTGAEVSGPMNVSGPTSSEPTNFAGTVSGNSIVLKAAHGSGTLTVNGDQMSGIVYGIMPATVSLTRQR
jgi:hypothetical protein